MRHYGLEQIRKSNKNEALKLQRNAISPTVTHPNTGHTRSCLTSLIELYLQFLQCLFVHALSKLQYLLENLTYQNGSFLLCFLSTPWLFSFSEKEKY
jgi:hypothetical protein